MVSSGKWNFGLQEWFYFYLDFGCKLFAGKFLLPIYAFWFWIILRNHSQRSFKIFKRRAIAHIIIFCLWRRERVIYWYKPIWWLWVSCCAELLLFGIDFFGEPRQPEPGISHYESGQQKGRKWHFSSRLVYKNIPPKTIFLNKDWADKMRIQ